MASRHSLRRTVALLAIGLVSTVGASTPAFAGSTGLDAAPAGHPTLADPAPCTEVANFTCAYLSVPLDHSGAKPGRLRLRVAVADNVTAPRGVLLLLTGGPGQPGAGLAARVAGRLSGLLHDYRLVLIDQRGTGVTAIDCPRLQSEVGSSDVLAPSATAVTECANLLGGARNFYTTADTVADLDELREALGVPRWTVDGISYGTFVGEHYALTYPGRVSRLVLDSVVPQDGVPALYEDSLHRTGWVLRQACAEQQCGFDPAADLATVVRRDGNGVGVMNLLIIASIVEPKLTGEQFFPVLWMLHASATGNPGPLNNAVQELGTGEGTPIDQFSAGLHAATLCAELDDAPWGDASAPLAGRDEAVQRALSKVDPQFVWPYEPATAVAQGLVATCRYWPPSRPNPAPRLDRLTMPVLLLAGDRDLSTPLAWAQAEAAHASHAQLVVVPGMGHSIQGRNAVGDAAVHEFLLGHP
jgi:pimeloyl-ACP methyl ester carboxylesterase